MESSWRYLSKASSPQAFSLWESSLVPQLCDSLPGFSFFGGLGELALARHLWYWVRVEPEQESNKYRDDDVERPELDEPPPLPKNPTLQELWDAVDRGDIPDCIGESEEECIVSLHRIQLQAGTVEPHGDYERPVHREVGVPQWWMEQVHPSETGEPYTEEDLERGYEAGFLERPGTDS